MKETQIKQSEATEDVRQVEQKKEQKYIGQITPFKGHTLWQVELKTGVITCAEFESGELVLGQKAGRRKLVVHPGCVYVSALNKKGVQRHMKKGSVGDKFESLSNKEWKITT